MTSFFKKHSVEFLKTWETIDVDWQNGVWAMVITILLSEAWRIVRAHELIKHNDKAQIHSIVYMQGVNISKTIFPFVYMAFLINGKLMPKNIALGIVYFFLNFLVHSLLISKFGVWWDKKFCIYVPPSKQGFMNKIKKIKKGRKK